MTRRGFTLVEVMVAITVTGLVTALAYQCVAVILGTREAVQRIHRDAMADLRYRQTAEQLLRYMVPATGVDDTTWRIVPTAAGDRLLFHSRGVLEPLGTSAPWRVEIAPGDGDALVLVAAATTRDSASLSATIGSVRNFSVTAIPADRGGLSKSRAMAGTQVPAAFLLRWRGRRGEDSLYVRTTLEPVIGGLSR